MAENPTGEHAAGESRDETRDVRTAELSGRLDAVRHRLATAVATAGRPPGAVELLVVTKFFPAADVRRLLHLGVREFGESREPEASRKIADVRADPGVDGLETPPVFDMIGSVQTKKAGSVARWARQVHSVDRDKLAVRLSDAAHVALEEGHRTTPLGILLQVSLDGDPHRGGLVEGDLTAVADLVAAAPALSLRGLMAIAPLADEPERWMAEFARIGEVFRSNHPTASEVSAGMSGDLDIAVTYGSTCVRVGTAIMGKRPLVSQ